MSNYHKRDIEALDAAGGYYSRHVEAMSKEALHDPKDIAAELAHRDMVIDKLINAADKVSSLVAKLSESPK